MSFLIKARVQFEGLHYWSDAPARVAFLQNPHRHLFTILATKKTEHSNRDIEFLCFKHDIQNFIKTLFPHEDNICMLESTSCEMLAKIVGKQFKCEEVEVWEDMENAGVWVNA